MWIPIGWFNQSSYKQYCFSGVFDGGGYAITNLQVSTSLYCVGLFGLVDSATIRNVIVASGSIKTTLGAVVSSNLYSCIGSIAGRCQKSTIENCHNTGCTVHTSLRTGGIVGDCYGTSTITRCHNAATVNNQGEYNSIRPSSGGIIGVFRNRTTYILNCYNTAMIRGTSNTYCGGICGSRDYDNVEIKNCFNTGTVTGSDYSAGIISDATSSSYVENCYNTGTVQFEFFYSGPTARYCYSSSSDNAFKRPGFPGSYSNCGRFTSDGTLTPESGQSIIDSCTTLLSALNRWIELLENDTERAKYSTWTTGNSTAPCVYAITVTVTLNPNGGSVTPTSLTLALGSTYGTLPTPSYSTYVFKGWYTAATGGSEVTSDTVMDKSSDHTLYAHWSITYKVTFNPNGGSVTPSSITVENGDKYGELPTPVRTKYKFAGWYTDATDGDEVISTTVVDLTGNITLYAHWVAVHNVTFNANGGSVTTTSKEVEDGSTYGSLPTPTRTGYVFDGWYTAVSGGTLVTSTTAVSGTEDETLYAHWSIGTYTITFVSNGGTAVASITQEYNTPIQEPTSPTRSGAEFGGWYADASLTTKFVFSTMPGSDTNVYALWLVKSTVTFNPTSGSCSTLSKTVTSHSAYGELPTPTLEGYTFVGWYTSLSEGSEVTASTSVTETSDHSLYARWSINSYTISFNTLGGSVVYAITKEYKQPITLPTDVTKEGYRFHGWYEDSNCVTPTTITTMPAHDTILYAKWTESKSSVSDGEDGDGGGGSGMALWEIIITICGVVSAIAGAIGGVVSCVKKCCCCGLCSRDENPFKINNTVHLHVYDGYKLPPCVQQVPTADADD